MASDPKDVRSRRSYTETEWKKANEEADVDDRYRGGDPYDQDQKTVVRLQIGRDPLVFDELGQYINKIINKVMEMPLGIVTSPANSRANEITAADRNDIIRGIEYTGNAPIARRSAFEPMVIGGFGSYGLTAVNRPGSRHQDAAYRIFQHRSMVLPDPMFTSVTSQGKKWCFVNTLRMKKEHEREYGKDSTDAMAPSDPDLSSWQQLGEDGEQYVVEAEYWYLDEKTDEVLYIDGPNGEEEDAYTSKLLKNGYVIDGGMVFAPAMDQMGNLIPGAKPLPYGKIVGQRKEQVPAVYMDITNGYATVKTSEWDTPDIPIIMMLSRPTWRKVNKRLMREFPSLIRLVRDAVMGLNFSRNKQAVLVGGAPLTPFLAAEGQLSGYEKDWQESATKPKAVLTYKSIIPGVNGPDGHPIVHGPPTRMQNEPAIQALEIFAEAMRRHIQSGVGLTGLPTNMQRLNDKSGVALQEIEQSMDLGAYNFIDSYKQAVMFEGKIWNDKIDVLATKGRSMPGVTVLRKNTMLKIGMPNEDPKTGETRVVNLGLAADHTVTVDVGDAKTNQDDADELAAEMLKIAIPIALQMNPGLATTVAAQAIRTIKPTPEKDEIADTFDPKEKDSPAAQLQQAKGIIQQMQAKLQEDDQIINGLAKRNEQLQSGIEKQMVADHGRLADTALQGKMDAMLELLKQHGENQRSAVEEENKDKQMDRDVKGKALDLHMGEISAELAHERGQEAMIAQHALEPDEAKEGSE